MRLALLSDIHGNLRAFDACLADLRAQGGADRIVGVGDYCMDGPQPKAVLERLVEVGAVCLRGNTDRYLSDVEAFPVAGGKAGGGEADSVNNANENENENEEEAALRWQRAALGPAWLRWLAELPFALRFGEGPDALLAVHANPKTDDDHIWPDASDRDLERVTDGVPERTIAFGHLHLPYVRSWRDKLLVNVSSAGLPKDGDPRAGYALLTQRSGGWEVKHRRVPFDVERVVDEIEKSGMPSPRKRVRVLRRHRYKQLDERIP
jgi:predicted phosphodiesterase